MTTQAAATIIFKEGVTQEEAIAALRTIKHLLAVPTEVITKTVMCKTVEESVANGGWIKSQETRPYSGKDLVKMFNPEHGTPTFYIP